MLGFCIERRRRFIENQQQRLLPHETARKRELLPLTERHVDTSGPRRPELRIQSRSESRDDIARACTVDGADDRRLIVDTRGVAETDRVSRAKLESKEILERTRQPR